MVKGENGLNCRHYKVTTQKRSSRVSVDLQTLRRVLRSTMSTLNRSSQTWMPPTNSLFPMFVSSITYLRTPLDPRLCGCRGEKGSLLTLRRLNLCLNTPSTLRSRLWTKDIGVESGTTLGNPLTSTTVILLS